MVNYAQVKLVLVEISLNDEVTTISKATMLPSIAHVKVNNKIDRRFFPMEIEIKAYHIVAENYLQICYKNK